MLLWGVFIEVGHHWRPPLNPAMFWFHRCFGPSRLVRKLQQQQRNCKWGDHKGFWGLSEVPLVLGMLLPLSVNRFVKLRGEDSPSVLLGQTETAFPNVVNTVSEITPGWHFCSRWHFTTKILHDRWLCLTPKLYHFNWNDAAAAGRNFFISFFFFILCTSSLRSHCSSISYSAASLEPQ